jgi:Fur family ferric uptake transcriptional regulator
MTKVTLMSEKTEELMEELREAGLRCTAPRLRLIRALAGLPRHFSAEEALRALNAGPGEPVSRATLYRFLGQLERLGVLRRAQLAEGHGHYEIAEGRPEHCHLVCAGCGRVVEVPSAPLTRRVGRLAQDQGFAARPLAIEITLAQCDHCTRPTEVPAP